MAEEFLRAKGLWTDDSHRPKLASSSACVAAQRRLPGQAPAPWASVPFGPSGRCLRPKPGPLVPDEELESQRDSDSFQQPMRGESPSNSYVGRPRVLVKQ